LREAAGGGCTSWLIGAALALVSSSCATAGGGAQLQADLDALQQQVWKLEKDNAALVQQVTRTGAAPTAPDMAMAELRVRLEGLERDVQVLRTRSDETDQRLGSLQAELKAARQALESAARSQAALAPPAAATPFPATESGAPPGTGSTPLPAAPGAVPATAIGVDLYRLGYSDYSKGNYDLALAELQDFVRLNPADDLADDAQYLIGEVYFSQQKYPDAVAAYDRLLAEHAGGDKAAAAYLKKGLALLEMNRTADAVIQLQHIVSAYPKSEEARLARERLRALGLRER
jgi:tol-pal system protein YbgF